MNQPAAPLPARVAIVGGGFSGAMVAVHLAATSRIPLAIHVIEPREMLGGGVAYSAVDPAHRINVPASRMIVFSGDPEQFDRWLRARPILDSDPAAQWSDGSAFPQRAVFGRYIAELVAEAGRRDPGVTIQHHRTTVTDIAAQRDGYALGLQDGGTLQADLVILAVSHPPPSVPGPLRGVQAAGAKVIADPWRPGALDGIAPDAAVLVVGTGLTMADAISTLDRRGHRGPITAISRRGLLSRGHIFGAVAKRTWFTASPPEHTALGLSRAVRAQIAAAAFAGEPWQAVFDDVRANAGRIWGALDVTERRRLVRHLRPFWDVHRFRVAPQAESAIARLAASGQFHARAASLKDAIWDGAKLAVRVHPRGAASGSDVIIEADAVIVTTGPDHRGVITSNPALASLARSGHIRPDPAGLGLDVDASNAAIGVDGAAQACLLVVGPLARGRVGELMGLPQVSEHARSVAEIAAASLLNRARGTSPAAYDAAQQATAAASPML